MARKQNRVGQLQTGQRLLAGRDQRFARQDGLGYIPDNGRVPGLSFLKRNLDLDRISLGSLTHSVHWLDLSLEVLPRTP
jgi:hypothetical protein